MENWNSFELPGFIWNAELHMGYKDSYGILGFIWNAELHMEYKDS